MILAITFWMKLIQYNYHPLLDVILFVNNIFSSHIQALKADINATIVTSTVTFSWGVSKQEVLALGCMDRNVVVAFCLVGFLWSL